MPKAVSVRFPMILAMLLTAAPAFPCGESMFRVGFGMEIPAGSVQQPADIVIFKASNSSPDVFFDDTKVAAKLGKAGHRVARMDGASPAPSSADIVLARADELNRAREALGGQFAKAVFLPVTEGFGSAAQGAELNLSANSTLRQILGVLQRAMQAVAS